MTQSTSHDTPAEKTLAEHRALHALLGEVEKATSDPAAAAADQTLTGRLALLREQLAAHFAGEEDSGLYEQIQEMAPEHAHDCERLCAEHEGLLKRLDAIGAVDPASRDARFTDDVRQLLEDLDSHESRENEILTRVLDGGDQAQD
jgi:hypothetical protein